MAYNDDSVLARLSSLNETHDSIATAAQWIMFHRRHADRTVQLWMQRLKDSSATRRLSLLYLANEVAQQSKIRNKNDFIDAFSPVIAEAIATAYKGAPPEVQTKLKRVIDVWRDRGIFEVPIIGAIDVRVNNLDKSRSSARPGLSGAPFGGGPAVPSEFQPLVKALESVVKLSTPLEATITSANQEYEKQTDATTPQPSAPVYAARLNGLLKTLATAENAVAECVKARESLVTGLQDLLETHRQALDEERTASSKLLGHKSEIEKTKNEVELGIMRSLGPVDDKGTPAEGAVSPGEPERPQMEALTPDMEPFTPPEVPDVPQDLGLNEDNKRSGSPAGPHAASVDGSNKRRKVADSGEMPHLGVDDGIDPEVAAMLDSGAGRYTPQRQ